MNYIHKTALVLADTSEHIAQKVEDKLNQIHNDKGYSDINIDIKSVQYVHTNSLLAVWTAFIYYVITTA